MNFSELPPSKQWAVLKFRGEKFAEVWFKPADEPLGIIFRIPRESFQRPGMLQLLTAENLLKAVGIPATDVEWWQHDDATQDSADEAACEFDQPLSPPDDDTHRTIQVTLKPPSEEVDPDEAEPEATAAEDAAPEAEAPEEAASEEAVSEETQPETAAAEEAAPAGGSTLETLEIRWLDLESRWRAVLESEAGIETLRLQLETLVAQIENATKHTLMTEEKLHARKADIAAWTKAKSRAHHTLPKVREFIHRATWVVGTPEKKKIDGIFKEHENQPEMPPARMRRLFDQMENLLKDRQVLASHGVNVCQECRTVASVIQGALTTLRNGAAVNADRARRAARPKGKFFKSVRKWSGAD